MNRQIYNNLELKTSLLANIFSKFKHPFVEEIFQIIWKKLVSGKINRSAAIIFFCTGDAFQAVVFVPDPENAQECKNQGFFVVDDFFIGKYNFCFTAFFDAFEQKSIKSTATCHQNILSFCFMNGISYLIGNVFGDSS